VGRARAGAAGRELEWPDLRRRPASASPAAACCGRSRSADAEELYWLVERNRAYLAEWIPWAADQTLEGTVEFIRKTRKQLEENDGFQTALVLDGRIVGSVGYLGVSWEARSTSIGYCRPKATAGAGRSPSAWASSGRACSGSTSAGASAWWTSWCTPCSPPNGSGEGVLPDFFVISTKKSGSTP
jgi:hypothetical protein